MSNDCPSTKDGYLAFDALSIKQHIKDRLNESGVFTDQNYEGSYISTVIDIVSYTFNALMFYLNKTSTESMFSDAQIYENMNRIVKLLDYKPIGFQSSTLAFNAVANGIGETTDIGLYTIPRYSYIQLGGIPYSFNEDITFAKTVSGSETLTNLSNEKLLYQGKYEEYPIYTAIGEENEQIVLTPGDNIIIDHFNVDVYVKPNPSEGGTWEQWEATPSLYLQRSTEKKYEIRLNENKRYEIKFGNGINGKKLDKGSSVAIYYLKSDGEDGEVGVGALNGQELIKYSTSQFNTILTDVIAGEYEILDSLSDLEFTNDKVSTYSSEGEDSNTIRENAPGIFRSQYRLVTADDYKNYIQTNFANLISDVSVVNNWQYLSEQMKYYYDLGITNPNSVSRILFNQVNFSDSCNFNNVYIIAVPKVISNSIKPEVGLSPAQKELIITSMRSEKTLTSEVIMVDPVYVALSFAISKNDSTITPSDVENSKLVVIKDEFSRRDNTSIQSDVVKVFTDYFARKNIELGQTIDIKQLTFDILSVNGVKTFYTQRTDDSSVKIEKLSMLVWNPIYQTDAIAINNNYSLPYFKFPYLYNTSMFSNFVEVTTESSVYTAVEY
jgi:DNA-dependent RNA polymerase auxiliary subunit epsilon